MGDRNRLPPAELARRGFNPANLGAALTTNNRPQGFGSSGQTVGGPGSGSMSINYDPMGAGAGAGGVTGMNPAGAGTGSGPTDAYGQAAMGFLQNTLSGKEAPYNDAVKSAMLGRGSDMAAAAETVRNTTAREAVAGGGADMSDPSARAGINESMARRQSDNIGVAQGIDMKANEANFDAKAGAANTLANFSRADAQRRQAYLESLRRGDQDELSYNPDQSSIKPYGGLDMKSPVYQPPKNPYANSGQDRFTPTW